MTGAELRTIRSYMGMTAVEFGRALGFAGKDGSLASQIYRFEHDLRPIKPWIGRLARALVILKKVGIKPDHLGEAA